MKKLLYGIIAVLFISSISSCNGGEEKKTETTDSLSQTTTTANDTLVKPLYDFLHISMKVPAEKFRADVFTPELASICTDDSTAFAVKYIAGAVPVLSNSQSFTFTVYDLYHIMQTQLGLQKIQEPGVDIYNGIRVYPAIETNGATKELYLVLMGEKITANPRTYTTIRNKKAYTIRGTVFSTIPNPSAEYAQLMPDILAFQNFWMQQEGLGSLNDINRNTCFSISEYYEMLNLMDPTSKMIKDTINATGKYKIILYPCLRDKKLRFVAKGFENATKIPGSDIFNNMDVCPTRCPSNEIQ